MRALPIALNSVSRSELLLKGVDGIGGMGWPADCAERAAIIARVQMSLWMMQLTIDLPDVMAVWSGICPFVSWQGYIKQNSAPKGTINL
jgi:hypothetical protein